MERKYIKLNDNYSHLSIGNIISVIKDESKNKTSAIQSEVFCALFEIEYINESTVNNYCIGCRSISSDYKQIFINRKKRYLKNNNEFISTICNIITIITGTIFDIENISTINENLAFQSITKKLYNISKNDFYVPKTLISTLRNLILESNYYKAFIEMLLYAVLDKKQPLYEDEKNKNVVETMLQNTDISVIDLQNFLILELNEGINFSHSLKKLAEEGNAYALYRLGISEFRGEYAGVPRYDIAYTYFEKAAQNNHPSANWMIGNMIISNKVGNKNYDKAVHYFECAKKLGNVAAVNSLGICYKFGYGVKKDEIKALNYFMEAANKNYAYAFNNLGIYYEEQKEYEKSYNCFLQSASLGESYACNKIGELEREKGNYKIAYTYYNKALDSTYREITLWAYYNLAKYYYLTGNLETNIIKDINKAIQYFEKSSSLINSLIELLYIYYELYLDNHKTSTKEKCLLYKNLIEHHKDYNNTIKKNIEDKIQDIKKIDKINLSI